MEYLLCNISDIAEGEMLQVKLQELSLAIYLVEGQVFVTDDTCTHGQASLARDGSLEGYVVTCSLHDGQFDIRNGRCVAAPCIRPLKTYQAMISATGEVTAVIDRDSKLLAQK